MSAQKKAQTGLLKTTENIVFLKEEPVSSSLALLLHSLSCNVRFSHRFAAVNAVTAVASKDMTGHFKMDVKVTTIALSSLHFLLQCLYLRKPIFNIHFYYHIIKILNQQKNVSYQVSNWT